MLILSVYAERDEARLAQEAVAEAQELVRESEMARDTVAGNRAWVAALAREQAAETSLVRSLERVSSLEAALEAEVARRVKAEAALRAAERALGGLTAPSKGGGGSSPAIGGWTDPIEGPYRISATFGQSGPNWSSTHTGLDFAAGTGTGVVAIGSGRITFAGFDGSYGNMVEVTHGNGVTSRYAHLSAITNSGDVAAGDKIGEVGSTGNSTGPHLHLEIRDGGLVDPMTWLASHGVNV